MISSPQNETILQHLRLLEYEGDFFPVVRAHASRFCCIAFTGNGR